MRNLNYLTRHNLWTDIVYSVAYADRDYLYEQRRHFEKEDNFDWVMVVEQAVENYNAK